VLGWTVWGIWVTLGHGLVVCGSGSGIDVFCLPCATPQRIRVPWKRFLTQLQMVQFVLCATHSFYALFTGVYPARMCMLELWVMFNMLFLFYNFYSKKYNRGKGECQLL